MVTRLIETYSRRNFIATIPVLFLGGCASNDPDPPAIGEITLLNTQSENVEVSFLARKDGEVVTDNTYVIPGQDGSTANEVSVVKSWMGIQRDIEIDISAHSIGSTTFSTSSFAERFDDDIECLPLNIIIKQNNIEIFYGMDGCPEVDN